MGRPRTIADDELLEIARKVFRDYGHNATTRQVADAAGISQGVLFQRFKTKDELFFAALSHHSSSLAALTAIDATRHTPRTYLAEFGARAREHYRNVIPNILTIAAHPKSEYGAEMMRQIHRHNRAGEMSAILEIQLKKWQQAGEIGPGPVVNFAHTFLHALHTKAMVEVLSGREKSPSQPEDMQEFVDVFWHGLKPDKPARRR